jgi:localization factor PodJL
LPPATPSHPIAKSERAETNSDPVATGSVQESPSPAPHASPPPLPPHPPAHSPSADKPTGADKLPSSIGSGGLRAAALKGDAGAEYEIAQRYADGHGVFKDLTAAAQWFERAAKQGMAQAQFRLGGQYEKGLGVKKDIEAARRLYTEAAEAGHAKAMHNLAVLYAEGSAGKPDYQTAARWFRKAADYGVVDSQYNLGILYARGIGVTANPTEAYKWFALASRNGDADAAKKRDEVGKRLDPKSLALATAAVQAWSAATQPEAAIDVKAPAGGWDNMRSSSLIKRHVGPKGTVASNAAQ